MEENHPSTPPQNNEDRRPNRRPSRPMPRGPRMNGPQAQPAGDAPASSAQKQSNTQDRFMRPSLSRHGARPAGGDRMQQASNRGFVTSSERTNERANGFPRSPQRTPAPRNPRLSEGTQPQVTRRPNPRRQTPEGQPGTGGPGSGERLNRRRFSPPRGGDNKYAMVSQITEDAKTSTTKQVVLSSASRKLRIIPLGGAGETGSKNMTVFEYGEDILVVDCGIAFAGPEHPGIDSLIPDVRYLEERKANIRGMVFTHGHEDHIGAVPFIWPKLGCPMYATPLAGGLIQHKLTEAGITNAPMTVVQPGDNLHFGKISVEMVRLTHSIPDVLGLAIRCPAGLFFYATDWRLEHTPALGKPADWTRIAQLAGEGITALFSDSTNVDRPGYSPTERTIGDAFDRIFQDAKSRIILAQFASNINRVQQVLNSAKKFGRKVALSGRSMETYINIAMNLGYIKVPEGMLVDLRKVNTIDPQKVVILSTGSQGEEFSALVRMSEGAHRHVKLNPADTVVLSASAIPGNEDKVERLLTNLYREGVNVINNKLVADVHVSGHPSRDELKMMIALAQPQHFIPIHGSYPKMVDHGHVAVEMGVEPEKVILMENGQVVEFDPEKGGRISAERVQIEDVMIDGKKIGDVGPIVIRDRKTLGDEGMVTFFIVAKQKTGEMVTSPDIITRGFVYIREAEQLMHQLREEVKRSYLAAQKRHSGSMEDLKAAMRDDIAKFLEEETGRTPMIIPVITTV